MTDQPPTERRSTVESVALLEGVRQFTESNHELAAAVRESFAARRRGWIIGSVVAVLLLLQGGGVLAVERNLVNNSRNAIDQRDKQQQTLNNVVRLLNDVEAVTNPQAQAKSQTAQAQVVAEIVLCVENHQDMLSNPNVPLRVGCPGGP